MKTAVIYSGAMRSFAKTFPNHRWQLWRHFPDARFFCATHDDDEFPTVANLPPGSIIAKFTQPELPVPVGCPAEWAQGQPYMHEPYAISVSPVAVMGQLWLLREAWRMVEHEGFKPDLVVRVRPDLWFHAMDWRRGEWVPGSAESPALELGMVWAPWWGRFGGINDRFAIMTGTAAPDYFGTFDRLQMLIDAGAPLHPESLLAANLERSGHYVESKLPVEFSTMRIGGDVRAPEIVPGDLWRKSRS